MSILAGYVLGLHQRTEYATREVLELVHWHPLFFRKLKKGDYKKGFLSGYFKQKKTIEIEVPYSDMDLTDLILISEDQIRLGVGETCNINSSVLCSGSLVKLSGRTVNSNYSIINSKNYVFLNGGSVNLRKTSILYGGKEEVGYLDIDGKADISDSTIERFRIEFKKSSISIENSDLKNCGKTQFDCSEISSIALRNCTLSTSNEGPILDIKSSTYIYAPPACKINIEGCSFRFLDGKATSREAIRVTEDTIEKREFFDRMEINISASNLQRERTTEKSMLETMRKIDPKYKYTGSELKSKTTIFSATKCENQ